MTFSQTENKLHIISNGAEFIINDEVTSLSIIGEAIIGYVSNGTTGQKSGLISLYSEISEDPNYLPKAPDTPADQFELISISPNPFNSTAYIEYSIGKQGFTTIKLYDLQGKFISALIGVHQAAGHHVVSIDAKQFSAGIYFVHIDSDNFSTVQKLILLK